MGALKKILVLLIIAALAGVAFKVYKSRMPQGEAGAPPMGAMGPVPVSVAEVIERDVQLWDDFSGRLTAVNQVDIRPRVSGTIDTVDFKDGAFVDKGDLLFTIDPKPYQAEVSRAEGALASAKAQEKLARTEFARGERLFKEKTIPQRDYDQRKNAVTVAEANVSSALAALDRAKLDLGYTEIRAPIAGKAGRAEITVGNLVGAGPTAPVLTTLVSHTPIYADFEMDEATFLRYVQNATKEISRIPVMMGLASDTGTPYEGHVESFDNRMDSASGTIRVRAVFDNPEGALVPGFFAHLKIGSPDKVHVFLVSPRALGTDQDKKFVYIVGDDNKVAYREVTLGPMSEGLQVIRTGLQPGEKIVVNGLQRVHPGQDVKPETVPMTDDAPPEGQQQP